MKLKTHEQFIAELHALYPSIKPIDYYINAYTKIRFKCTVCDNIWTAAPHTVLSGHGCPKCGIKRRNDYKRKDHSQFISELIEINPDISVLGRYENNHTPILCECKNCNYQWYSRPYDLLKGKSCPNCYGHSGTSFLEQFIFTAFSETMGTDKVYNREKNMIGLELDILIPSIKLAIEPGSWLWHKNIVNRDLQKKELCRQKGIDLIIIYDSCDLSNPICDNNYIFNYDLSSKANFDSLLKLTNKIMTDYNVNTELLTSNFDSFVKLAKTRARRKGTLSFKEELSKVNPNITVLGEYTKTHEKILFKCNTCGYEWMCTPSSLLSGSGCPRCAGNKKKTQEEFAEQVSEIDPNIVIIGNYTNDSKRIECQCKICGNIWNPLATSLIQGHGCPKCATKRNAEKASKSHGDFVKELANKNPEILVLSQYKNAKTKFSVNVSYVTISGW